MSYTWIQTPATTQDWYGIASDSTGQYLAAIVFGGSGSVGIYTSSDFGSSWTQTFFSNIIGIASNSTGQYLAAIYSDDIYTSSDYGSSWSTITLPNFPSLEVIASDSSGAQLIVAGTGVSGIGGIYRSTDSGSSWTQTLAFNATVWAGVACSSSGEFVYAAYQTSTLGGGIYTSSNNGSTWTLTSAPDNFWLGITCSSSGQYVYAIVFGGGIYASSDYGSNWSQTSAPIKQWRGITCSSSGQIVNAVYYSSTLGGGIYTSSDYGSSWTLTSAPDNFWVGITSSSSGSYLFAVVSAGGIYRGIINTNYIVNGVGDLSTLFLPLSGGTSTTPTGYLYNAGTLLAPNYQDLNTLFAAYFAPPAAPTTHFFSSAHGGNDLNIVFQNIEPPISYIVNSQSNIIISQYKNINGYNAVTFQCLYPTSTVGLANITSFAALNNVTIIIVGGGGGGGSLAAQGGGGGGSLTYSLSTSIPTNSTFNIQVGNGGTGGLSGTSGTLQNGVNGSTSSLTVTDNSISAQILNLEATGGQGGLNAVEAIVQPTLGGGGVGNVISTSFSTSGLKLVGGGGGSGGSFTAAGTNAAIGGSGGTPTGSGTLYNGVNGANCSGTAINASHSGTGGNSGLTSVSLPFFTSSTNITLGGGGGGSSNQNGSNQLGSWCGAAGKGTGGAGSVYNGYTGSGSSAFPKADVIAGSGTNSITTGYGGGGGAGCNAAHTPATNFSEAGYGGNGGAGVVILYWPVPP